MSDFSTDFAAVAVPDVFGHFADTVTYKALGDGAGTSVSGIFVETGQDEDSGETGRTIRKTATIAVKSSEVTAPSVKDTFVVDSNEWSVDRVGDVVNGVAELDLVRMPNLERAPGSYRTT